MKIYKHPRTSNIWIVSSIVLLLAITAATSCRSRKARSASATHKMIAAAAPKFDENDAADALADIFEPRNNDSIWAKKKIFDVAQVMQKAYKDSEYYPIWLTENGDTSYIVRLFNELADMQNDGINTERYRLKDLRVMLNKYRAAKEVSVADVIALDTACTHSYLLASRDLLLGLVIPKQADSLWFHVNDSAWAPYGLLAAMGKGEADYPSLDSFRSHLPTYQMLRDVQKKYTSLAADSNYIKAKAAMMTGANTGDSILSIVLNAELPWQPESSDSLTGTSSLLKNYQYYLGLKQTGKLDSTTRFYLANAIDSIRARAALNQERIRWMPQKIENTYLLVNVPLMELFLRVNGENTMHMEVVVGKSIRQTPSLNAYMANVVINPPWGVPPTIMKKDVLPGLLKNGAAYLNKKGLKVYDFKGNQVSPSVVTASNYKRYVFRQAPGDDNALGYVKFNLPNKWDIYLHDTPHREDFGKKDRAKSSGCIRVQQPKEMAEFILTVLNGKRYPIERIDSVITTKKTRYEVLNNKIPVHIVYLTAFEDSKNARIHFIPDIYKRDRKLQALLN